MGMSSRYHYPACDRRQPPTFTDRPGRLLTGHGPSQRATSPSELAPAEHSAARAADSGGHADHAGPRSVRNLRRDDTDPRRLGMVTSGQLSDYPGYRCTAPGNSATGTRDQYNVNFSEPHQHAASSNVTAPLQPRRVPRKQVRPPRDVGHAEHIVGGIAVTRGRINSHDHGRAHPASSPAFLASADEGAAEIDRQPNKLTIVRCSALRQEFSACGHPWPPSDRRAPSHCTH